jgi:tetratricopeptide (TPR) repeat protein
LASFLVLALTAQLDALHDPKTRLVAAQAVAALRVDDPAELLGRLAHPPRSSVDAFRRLFLEMWAQVPNWKSSDPMWIRKPEPPWTPPPRKKGEPRARRPPPHDPETLDWLAALNEVDVGKAAALDVDAQIPVEKPKKPRLAEAPAPSPSPMPAADLELARVEAMERVAILRALAATRRMELVDPLFKVAFELDGVFRDEVGRQLRSMESYAVPSLIRLMHAKGPGKMRRYASYQLDRMDRARPQKAIAAAPDDRVRAAIIHAYGEEHALEAVEAILAQVDASSHRVRNEARWSWLRYVSGKPPPPAPKRKRKLPGGKEEVEEKPDYLTYREIATLALQKELAAIEGAPVDARLSAKQLTDRLFAYYDARHAAEWDQQFATALARERAGDLQAATDEYGWILAHDPNYAHRSEMAHAFARFGDELRRKGELPRAVGFLRQAVDLDPTGPEAAWAGARVALCDGLLALSLGQAEPSLFRRAAQLDPSLTEASSGLYRAESAHARRRWLYTGESVAVGCLLLFGLWALWRRTSAAPRRA